jgi:hypothetical protein
MKPVAGLASVSLSTASTATEATRLNNPATTPASGIHHPGTNATSPAATRMTTRPGGIVGVSVTPATIWVTKPTAAISSATAVNRLVLGAGESANRAGRSGLVDAVGAGEGTGAS